MGQIAKITIETALETTTQFDIVIWDVIIIIRTSIMPHNTSVGRNTF